jgi:putative membrane protein
MDGGIAMMMGMFAFMALWLLIPAALIWLAVDRTRTSTADATTSALHILDERFARGEIDAEELRMKRLAIQGSRP